MDVEQNETPPTDQSQLDEEYEYQYEDSYQVGAGEGGGGRTASSVPSSSDVTVDPWKALEELESELARVGAS